MEDSPLAEASHAPSNNIWHVDYNATVAKDAAMGWQGMGFVLGFNGVMFLVALAIFQAGARSTRFSLFRFGSSSILSARAQEAAHFTLKKWGDLLWRTPIRDTDVEMRLGPEGTFYLLYQQYTARFLGVLSVFAMLVLLPLYLTIGANAMQQVEAAAEAAVKGIEAIAQGSTEGATDLFAVDAAASAMGSGSAAAQDDDNKWWSFAHATIRVMPNESPYLWVPVVMCYLTTLAFLRSSSIMSTATSVAAAGQTAGEADKSMNATEEAITPEVIVSPSKETPEAEDPEKQPLLGKDKEMATLEEQKVKTPERTHLIGMQPSSLSNRSLFVDRGIPKNLREQRMLRLLDEVFPGYVEDVSVVFNLAEFHGLQARRRQEETELARMKILHGRELNGEKPSWSLRLMPGGVMIPSLRLLFSNVLCCFRWCSKPVPMEEQEEQLANHIKKLREKEMTCLSRILHENKGAGRAFVIFKSARLRARFVRRVRNQSITSILARFPEHAQPRLVRYVRELGLTRWHLEAAPEPDDIDWQSVSFPFAKRTVVVLLVNVCILVVLLLFTSPIAVTSAISSSSSYSTGAAQSLSDLVAQLGDLLRKVSPRMAKLLANYIPTLILVMINAVLLNVLQIAGHIQPISTDSAKERLILRTASVYLIFNTIFVPSLAFMSIDAVLLYLEDDGEVLGMLGTLFLHNSGIFYVDYILQRCFLGTALVLLRATEYVKFSWAKPRALTPREQVQAVEADQFYTGTQSAMQISTLTIVLMFSTVVPLILPLGTLYFVMQHGVDKYSLLNVRRRIKGRGSIARTATHATCVSLLLYQGAMSGFILERGTTTQSAAVLVLLMGTYIVVLWDTTSLQSSGLPTKTEFPLSMLNLSLQPLEENESKGQKEAKDQGEPEEPPAGDEEAPGAESALTRRPLETLSESSALLMFPTSSDLDLLTGLDVDSSELYREPALRKSMRMSFGPQDLGDYGTWRQVYHGDRMAHSGQGAVPEMGCVRHELGVRGVTDLRDFVAACAPYGGPVALLRDPKKLVKVSSDSPLARQLLLFNACGHNSVLWTGRVSRTSGRRSMAGDEETRFTLLPPGSKDKVATFEAWGGGLVALTEKMALVQVLDVDSVRPKVLLLPDCGLSDANPPTCMALLEPKFLKSIYPEVLLGTSNKSLVIVSKDGGAQDMKLQESIAAPISAVAIAPNGLFMALFTQDGILTVLNTMMDKKILSFDTQSKASPLSMCWCGEDSVLMYWPSAGLVMVGPYGSWLRFPYSESIILAQEVDCCRVYSASSHDIVLRVPTCVENIKGVGSTAPAAMLYQALDAFDSGDAKADEHIRFILSQNALEDAIKDCVDAAGSEFDYASQTTLMRAASYGKCFVDSAMDASSALPGAQAQEQATGWWTPSSEVVVSRLVAMRHHFLALKICEYLTIPTDRVLVHWACEKVKAATSSDVSDEELVALVRKKLKNATLVSYADIANCAERVNRRRLATMFLDLEENASDQVPLLLSMGEFELALRKSLESNNTDLIYMTLFHLERTLPSMDEFRYVLNREPMYAEAVNLMLLYYRATKSSGSPALWTDVASAENDLLLSFKSTDVEEKTTALKDATTKYTNAKLPSHAKLTEEQVELLQEQGKLEEKPENVKRRKLVGQSISNTMKLLLRDSKYEPKLLPVVAAFAKKFKVPDKRFYRVKIKALAETRQWDALHKFSMEKKTPPCGFKAFAIACLEEGEKQQAENYTARITSVDEKFETLIHLDMYSDALQLAIKLKDPEKLTNVRNLCNDDNICNQADKAAMELGFVS
ncbi:WD40-repeat-containing domain [Phytophthora cactorum]|nr:WD40-repeat-containing domain [Phytophthora cactorum]